MILHDVTVYWCNTKIIRSYMLLQMIKISKLLQYGIAVKSYLHCKEL